MDWHTGWFSGLPKCLNTAVETIKIKIYLMSFDFDLTKYMRFKRHVKLWRKSFSDAGKHVYISIIIKGYNAELNWIECSHWFQVLIFILTNVNNISQWTAWFFKLLMTTHFPFRPICNFFPYNFDADVNRSLGDVDICVNYCRSMYYLNHRTCEKFNLCDIIIIWSLVYILH